MFVVQDLSLILPNTSQKGEKERKFAETRMNHSSSRSHCIFKIDFRAKILSSGTQISSVVNLIDLAGSEGVAKSDICGRRLKEGSSINKSLLAMYNVIKKLNKKSSFICFRESKLTRILQPYLGGNSLTSIICNINPHVSNYQESINTLRFALCAGGIRNNVKLNIKSQEGARQVEKFEKLVKELRERLSGLEKNEADYHSAIDKFDQDLGVYDEEIKKMSESAKVRAGELDCVNAELEKVEADHKELAEMNEQKRAVIKTYQKKFEELKDDNIYEQMEAMDQELDANRTQIERQTQEAHSRINELKEKHTGLKKQLKTKKEGLEVLQGKLEFVRFGSKVMSSSRQRSGAGRVKTSVSSVRKCEIKNMVKLLEKESELIDAVITTEQQNVKNLEQAWKYVRLKMDHVELKQLTKR